MQFPVWDLPLAHGLLIALVAVPHVFVAHIAVGGGLYLVITETLARRRHETRLLSLLELHSRFFLLLTLVFGAMTGVGIWFTIGLTNPAGTSSLIHTFVWGWAAEWCFFLIEILAALFYVYGWRRLSPRLHLTMGWIYFAAAWASLFIINGIITFQLSPGEWLQTRSFADGFFNPTFWSSLVLRTSWAFALAGLFGLWTATHRQAGSWKLWLNRYSALWAVIGIVGTAAATLWWWSDVPTQAQALTRGAMPIATLVTHWTPILAGVLLLVVIAGPLLAARRTPRVVAVLALALGLVTFGFGEWVREGIRKPWVIHGYLYSNGVRADEVETIRQNGVLASAPWTNSAVTDSLAIGEEIFRVSCQNCHSRDGYNGLAQRIERWQPALTTAMIERQEYMRRSMPPWMGTPSEARALALYLHTLPARTGPAAPAENGAAVFEVHCASCHSVGGIRDIRDYLGDMEAVEVAEFLGWLESDYMPPFTGSQTEADLLAEWIADLPPIPSETEVGR